MTKKSFKGNNPALNFISSPETHNEHYAQDVQAVQEVQVPHKEQRTPVAHTTQGKKGQKLPRINMAFATTNLEYLQIISRIEGVSVTEYVNRLIEADKETRKDIVKEVKKLLEGINK